MIVLNRIAARLRRDQRGASAVEFALIAPVMILLYFGLAEGAQALIAERKTIRTASAVGDLVAQYSTVTPAQVDDILKLGNVTMLPFPTATQLKICIASIESDSGNIKKIGWSRSSNNPVCPAKDAPVQDTDVPAALIAANQSLIMARVNYTYVGATNQIIKTNPTFTKTFYLRPRKSQTVLCPTC
jgi:Flp pilus assembly protein TadG